MTTAPAVIAPVAYRFGPFRLEPLRRVLLRGNSVVPLPERLYAILILLIRAGGNVVGKDVLAAEVWPGSDLTDGNLSQHVYLLRQLLGESARDRSYVMTVPGRGYRFAAPVTLELPDGDTPTYATPSGDEETLLSCGQEAFTLYSRGSYLLEKRTVRALTRAVEHFEAALRIDPNFVPALVGLARAFLFLGIYWYLPGASVFPKAQRLALRAIELEPSNGVAHALLAELLLFGEWDWHGAQREMAMAVLLAPNSTMVRSSAAWMHVFLGEPHKGMIEVQRALALEPASPLLQGLVGRFFIFEGEYRRAIDYLSTLLDGGPEFEGARRYRAQAYILAGQPEEAIADLQLLPEERTENVALRLPLLGRAYGDAGQTARAEEIYRFLRDLARVEFVVQANLACVAFGLGQTHQALVHLETSRELHEAALFMVRATHFFQPIERSDRYRAILDSVAPPHQRATRTE